MSLRHRLTLIYTGLLSGVVLLLSIVVYALVSVVMVNQVDDRLVLTSERIIGELQVLPTDQMDFRLDAFNIIEEIYFQVWSRAGQLVIQSENLEDLDQPLDTTAMAQDSSVFRNVDFNERNFRVLTIPLTLDDEAFGLLQVGLDLVVLNQTQSLLQIVFVISALFAVIVAGVVGWVVTGQALEPLEMMARITKQITSTDDLSQRIPVHADRHDEIGALVLTFNQTLVRLERLFNAQRRFLADVSHELRTPLTVIKGNVGLMRITKTYDHESLNSIEAEVDRLTRLVRDLLLMAQAETGKLPLMVEPVEVDDLLFEVYEQMEVLSEGKHDIRIGNIEPAIVTADRDRLKQVFLNLGSNAVNYTPAGGKIILSLYVRENWVQVIVSDEGRGIPKEELGRLFERFYRGDKSRSRHEDTVGFGLGLPIAYWIVRNHGGRIDVETAGDKGTTFSVWLPKSQAEIPTRPMDKIRKNRKAQEKRD